MNIKYVNFNFCIKYEVFLRKVLTTLSIYKIIFLTIEIFDRNFLYLHVILYTKMRSLMKVEFRNTPVNFRGNVFNNSKNYYITTPPQSAPVPESKPDEVTFTGKKTTIIGTAAAGLIGGLVWLGNVLKGKSSVKAPVQEISQTAQAAGDIIKAGFKTVMENFPDDFAYIKNMAKSLGLKEGDEFKLNSVMGKSQLKKLLDEFTPQDFSIGKDFEGAKKMTFRVNLHNHTNFSDGKMSVEEFLEQARKYADRIAENTPADNKPPFTIAITDHDTMEGCKEALKILSENPEKFKNLKVVLGSEISVSNCDSKIVSRPLNFELIGYCQNPYDEKLAKLLENIQQTRQENVEKFLEKMKEKFSDFEFNIDEAKNFHSNLRTMRTNGVLYLAGDYARFKVSLSKYVEKINKILPENAEKLSPENLFKQFCENYYYRMDAYGERNIPEYFEKHGLRDYLIEKGFLTQKNEKQFSEIFKTDLTEDEKFITKTVNESLPDLSDRKNYSLDPSQVFDATTEGFYGFAHPAIIDFASDNISPLRKDFCEKNQFSPHENLVYEIFNSLKQTGKEMFYASEINYQSYPKNADENWISFMKNSIADNKNLNLKYTGGIDAHKPSIFIKHKYMDEKILKELLGEI